MPRELLFMSKRARVLGYAADPDETTSPEPPSEGSTMEDKTSRRGARSTRRASAMSRVYLALTRDRWNLRRAARHAGSPGLKRRLRKLAFRRAQQTRDLADAVPPPDPPGVTGPDFARDIGRANEISTVAACLRSNRKLRIAIERALETEPSPKVTAKLERLKESAASEAGVLDARLREIAISGFDDSAPMLE